MLRFVSLSCVSTLILVYAGTSTECITSQDSLLSQTQLLYLFFFFYRRFDWTSCESPTLPPFTGRHYFCPGVFIRLSLWISPPPDCFHLKSFTCFIAFTCTVDKWCGDLESVLSIKKHNLKPNESRFTLVTRLIHKFSNKDPKFAWLTPFFFFFFFVHEYNVSSVNSPVTRFTNKQDASPNMIVCTTCTIASFRHLDYQSPFTFRHHDLIISVLRLFS